MGDAVLKITWADISARAVWWQDFGPKFRPCNTWWVKVAHGIGTLVKNRQILSFEFDSEVASTMSLQ